MWQEATALTLASDAVPRYHKGILLLVLARHLERTAGDVPPTFDAVHTRLKALVGALPHCKERAARHHYCYTLALDAQPSLAALPHDYLDIAHPRRTPHRHRP